MNFWLALLTGLTAGGITCMVVQGGLLASTIANQKKQELDYLKSKGLYFDRKVTKLDWQPVGLFLGAKLVAYTFLGLILGYIGSFLIMTLTTRVIFQLFTVFFMLATAMNLLNIHPIFRYVVFQPPKFLRRMIKKESKADKFFAPLVLGLMTIFIPCGVTQAMEVAAINSGQAITGALIMAGFVLGTMPWFALLGLLTAKLSETWEKGFNKAAGVLLIIMSLYMFNGVLAVLDAPIHAQKILGMKRVLNAYESNRPPAGAVQRVTIEVSNRGYTPDYFQVKMGVPVELKLKTNKSYSCANAFTMKAFDIFTQLQPVDEETFTFTPDKIGKFTFACSMGMYTGVMEVI